MSDDDDDAYIYQQLDLLHGAADDEGMDLLQELCDFCASDDLSLSRLQEKINSLFPSHNVIREDCYFFHKICLNENIAIEIVEYVINEFPGMTRLVACL